MRSDVIFTPSFSGSSLLGRFVTLIQTLTLDTERKASSRVCWLPSESFWLGFGMSLQLSVSSWMLSLSSSSSQSSPRPSLSESSWELLGMSGQLSLLS